jgi:predicted amidohydrolase YtcJ
MRLSFMVLTALVLSACGGAKQVTTPTGPSVVIYEADTILTMTGEGETAKAVAVSDGRILAVGTTETLAASYSGAEIDTTFNDAVIMPGLIDPHVHVMLGSLQYNLLLTPPWPMKTSDGWADPFEDKEAFLGAVKHFHDTTPGTQPLIIYGYHDLVHGALDRTDLDAISDTRPLVIWHYSSHDFYLNTAAIDRAGYTPALAEKFHGVDLDENGELTGRIYEDAVGVILQAYGDIILAPDNVTAGFDRFTEMLNEAGVTTVVEMGYGLFGRALEDPNIASNWGSPQQAGYNLFLVPEHRAMKREFGDDSVAAVGDLISGKIPAPAPVLPRVKFFTDGAFYSQTMKVSAPGYLAGQSEGTDGLWVTQPDAIVPMIQPYWDAGYGVNIHSNGDAAQTATLNALKTLRATGDNSFTIEHGGLFSTQNIEDAGTLRAGLSAASHYVYYMAEHYKAPLGEPRSAWISPLGPLSDAGVTIALHSDAPLAPPQPMRAASVHVTRTTVGEPRYEVQNALSPYDALESVTLDAARAVGLENEIGSIAPGKRADFTVLYRNPLTADVADWEGIGIWGVVLSGEKRPLSD